MKRDLPDDRCREESWTILKAIPESSAGEHASLSTGLQYTHKRRLSANAHGEDEFEFFATDTSQTWRSFLQNRSRNTPDSPGVADTFRAVLAVLDTENYHLRIENLHADSSIARGGFRIRCYANSPERKGPVSASRCMSCDEDCKLTMGIHGDVLPQSSADLALNTEDKENNTNSLVAKDTLLEQNEQLGLRYWIDAKARSMLIVTPFQHFESMSAMSDDDLTNLWTGCDSFVEKQNLPLSSVMAVILNCGTYRNHTHLHLKLKLSPKEFEQVRQAWDDTWLEKWERVKQFALRFARPVYEKELAKTSEDCRTVFCGQLGDLHESPSAVAEMQKDLHDACRKYGEVESCVVIPRKSIGFVTFAKHEQAARCIVDLFRKPVGRAKDPYFTWAKTHHNQQRH